MPKASERRPWAAFAFLTIAGGLLSACGERETQTSEDTASTAPRAAFSCGAPSLAIAGLERDASLVRQRLDASIVEVEGVVVGNFQGGLGGFFLQSAPGEDDGDPATPEGLFVEHRSEQPAPRVGRRMRVRGAWAAIEDPARGELALRRVERLLDCGASELPDAIQITQAPAAWSRLAGMRVTLPGPLSLTGNDNLLRFGEIWLSFGDRLIAPTEQAAPGTAARSLAAQNSQRLIVLDDGRRSQYPRQIWQLPQPPSAQAPYRSGSLIHGVQAVVDHRFGDWRLQATSPLARVEQAPRPQPPTRDRSLLRVSGFNALNFFNGDGQGGGFPTERGAGSRNDQIRQRDKLVAAITALDPDILGLMEIENDGYGPDSAIAELARALSDAHATRLGRPVDAHPVYSILDSGTPQLESDVIAVGLIYRNDRVRPVGEPSRLTGGPFGSDSRVPLAQAFTAVTGLDDDAFLIVVNHFKSKGCRDAGGEQADRDDGQACYGPVRLQSSHALIDWLNRENRPYGSARSLVIGDLNAHSQEPPIRTLLQRGLVDLPAQHGAAPHTYVFRGQTGRLDHALAGATLAARVRAAGVWAINADELPEFDYDGDARSGQQLYAGDAWRSSDHDPVWVDLEP